MLNWLRKGKGASGAPDWVLPVDERIYAIGDVHGRYDLLRDLVLRVVEDHQRRASDGRYSRIVFMGDYIDRGPQSREVLALLMALKDEPACPPVICLKGNHEAALLGFIDDPERGRRWLRFGGIQTLESYGLTAPGSDAEGAELEETALALRAAMGAQKDFLRDLPVAWRTGSLIFAHAGVDPRDPGGEDEEALLWGRSRFLKKGRVDGYQVVHGHYDAAEPVVTPGRICVDTGAYYSGRLTALRLDGGHAFVQAVGLGVASDAPGETPGDDGSERPILRAPA
ncbi:MAG: hypothetical protein CML68_15935 [Rhodobacteraceae bacterium]|nr:hypothetical protein [Paracoccaceae bacterium]